MITASQVKELREKTGAGMMECKKVLTETDGDIEKAMELLRERGITKAAKKASRVAAEGLVGSYISEDGKVGAIAEVNAETDFVAENAEFKQFVNDIVKQVALNNPADVEALLEEKFIADPEKTVKEALINKIATIGENITIRRFVRYDTTDGTLGQYVHGAGKIAVLVEMKNADAELTKDICMQIAASKPEFLNREQVPQERVDKEMDEGKPEAIAEKMVQGRIGKFYSDICLVDQEFVKDMDKKVSQLLKEKNAEVVRFARLEKGEGIEKKEENFAEEVAKQLK